MTAGNKTHPRVTKKHLTFTQGDIPITQEIIVIINLLDKSSITILF